MSWSRTSSTAAAAQHSGGLIDSPRDGINVLYDWLGRGVRLVATTQQLDFSGATGKLVAAVLFALAEIEPGTRRERQRAGIDAAREQGVYRGRLKGSTEATPQRAAELKQRGQSVPEIAAALQTSERTVQRYLRAV